jgi:hypothetical protein
VSDHDTIWIGILEAGASTSPVARDAQYDTGNPATVYLFNLRRGVIGEYRRDIVEAKLRELTPEEEPLRAEVDAAFDSARSGFVPRRQRGRSSPESVRRSEPRDPEPDLDDVQIPPEFAEEEPLLDDDAEPDEEDDGDED